MGRIRGWKMSAAGGLRPERVVIADPHTLFREALRECFRASRGLTVVGETGAADEAVRIVQDCRADILVLDTDMLPSTEDTVRQLLTAAPALIVVALSMRDDVVFIRLLLATGVRAFLHKSVTRAELLSVIHGVRSNRDRFVVSVPRTSHLLDVHTPYDTLSSREREVLALVGKALSNRQIGVRLHITEGTVKRHLRNIFHKLGATSRMDAANKAAAWSSPSLATDRDLA